MNDTTKKRVPILVWQLLLGMTFLLLWELGAAKGFLDPSLFSRPSFIAKEVSRLVLTGRFWLDVATTFIEAALSFAIGSLLGIVCGFVLARSPGTASLFEPYLRMANALPRVVLAPIFFLWFDVGIASKVALGVTVVFFVVFFNTFRGLREVDVVMIDNARILGASERQLIRHVFIPSALQIMARDEVARAAETAWTALKRNVLESVDDPSSALRTRIADSVMHIGESLRDDADLRDKVDDWIIRGARHLVSEYGVEITAIITETIERWDAEEASRRIELHVGRDLQFIRINGTVVGALAGLIIYTAAQLLF